MGVASESRPTKTAYTTMVAISTRSALTSAISRRSGLSL
jgi:hypothetical protein